MVKRISKLEDSQSLVDAQMRFYDDCDLECKPVCITRDDDFRWSYDYVEGDHPQGDHAVHHVYNWGLSLWHANYQLFNASQYVTYMDKVLKSLCGTLCITEQETKALLNAIKRWCFSGTFSPCNNVHGDLTLENCIVDKDNKIVFLDPGDPHGMYCRELDEAKLLQSAWLHWESLKRGWPIIEYDIPFGIRREHKFLLMTHLLRLMRHNEKHEAYLIEMAYRYVWALMEDLK